MICLSNNSLGCSQCRCDLQVVVMNLRMLAVWDSANYAISISGYPVVP